MTQILVLSILVALYVQSVWYVFQPGELLESVSFWLSKRLNARLWAPVFDCPVCMTPYHGLLFLYISAIVTDVGRVSTWPIVLLCAMGVQVVISKFEIHRHDDTKGT